MAKERSLVFIKPGHIDLGKEIFDFLEETLGKDFERLFDPVHINPMPKELLEEHYGHVKHLPFFEKAIKLFEDQGVIMTVYAGEDIVNRIREAVGHKCPKKAKKGTVRSKYGKGSAAEADAKGVFIENSIHASGSSKEAEQEIKVWRKHLGKNYKHLNTIM